MSSQLTVCTSDASPRRLLVDRHGHRRTTLAAGNEIGSPMFLLGPEFLRGGIPLSLPDQQDRAGSGRDNTLTTNRSG
jgi:hypothetical protein